MKKNTVGFIYSPNKNSTIKVCSLASKLLNINSLIEVKEVANTIPPKSELSYKPNIILTIE